jgi:FkbM family methyltransferase
MSNKLLKWLKAYHLISKGVSFSNAFYFNAWVGGGNAALVRRFNYKNGRLNDKKTGASFSHGVAALAGANLETLRVAIDEFNLAEVEARFWVFPKVNGKGLKIQLYSHSSLQVIFEVFREDMYSFFNARNSVVVDIGANIGIASIFFASHPLVDQVYGFELIPATYRLAKTNLEASNVLSKVQLLDHGIAAADGTFTIPAEEGGSVDASVYEVSRSAEKSLSGKTMDVRVRAVVPVLNEILAKHPGLAVVFKIDCEGTEYELINELAESKLLQKIDVIMMEWHYHGPEKLIAPLTKNGFTVFNRNIPNDGGLRGLIYAVNDQ